MCVRILLIDIKKDAYIAKVDVGLFLDGAAFCELRRKTRRCLPLAGGAFVGLVGDGADGRAGKRSSVVGAVRHPLVSGSLSLLLRELLEAVLIVKLFSPHKGA